MDIDHFLKQKAVKVAIGGNYVLPNWYDPKGKLRNFACRTSRINPHLMMVDVPVIGRVGQTVNSYFSDFGKFDATILDTARGGFLLEIRMTAAMRARLSDKLDWLESKQNDPKVRDARQDARIVPENPHATLTLADGKVHSCFVIDMSVSGVAVSSEVQPEIGTPLAVGAAVGRVVRLLPDGFAVKFIEPQKRRDLEWLMACSSPLRRTVMPPALTAPAALKSGMAVDVIEI